jgi:uncharacterized membrane protein
MSVATSPAISKSSDWPFGGLLGAHQDDAAYWSRCAGALITATAALRYLFIANVPLNDTEAYYVSWARFPSWSYYDHAPLTAWLVRVAEWLIPGPSAGRLVPVACAAATAWLLFVLGALLFSPRAGFFAALLTVASPAYFFIGILVNPEGALAPLWLLFLILLYGLTTQREWWRPLLLGAVLGLAFLGKYTGLLLLPIALAFVAATPRARHWLLRPSFYLGGLAALLVASPVVIWNAVHHWPTLHLHLVQRMSPTTAGTLAARAVHFAVGQCLTFHPLLFPVFAAALALCLWRARRDDRFRLLALAAALPGAFLAFVMIRANDAETHWMMVAYLPLAVAAGSWLDQHFDRLTRWGRRYLGAVLASSALFIGLALVDFTSPELTARIPGYSVANDPANELLGWDSLRAAVRSQADRLGADTVVVGSHNVLCGHLMEELGDQPRVYCVSPTQTAFDFFERGQPPKGAPVLYVDSARYTVSPAGLLPGRECRDVDSVDVERGGVLVGRFRIAECPAPPPIPTTPQQLAWTSSLGGSHGGE